MNKDIEKQIMLHKRNIERMKENLIIEKEKTKIQLNNPRPISPEYEFELQDEFLEHTKKVALLNFERKKEDIVEAIQINKEEINRLEKEGKKKTSRDYIG